MLPKTTIVKMFWCWVNFFLNIKKKSCLKVIYLLLGVCVCVWMNGLLLIKKVKLKICIQMEYVVRYEVSFFVCTIIHIIIHMRHFSGKINTRILLALLSLVWLRPYQTILPFFREISPLLPYSTVLKRSAISDHIALLSHRLRVCAEHFAHLSRVVRVM